MPPPLTNPPTHAQQLQLRETMRTAEKYIAIGLKRFEQLTGVSVSSVEIVRWDSGAYSPTIHLGPAVAPPSDPPAQV